MINKEKLSGWRLRAHIIIFEADSPWGKRFDIFLIVLILLSVLVVMLDSVSSMNQQFGEIFYWLEWIFTLLFTIEYVARIITVGNPFGYIFSFFGIIDLLAIFPTYLSIIFPASRYLVVIRMLRVLRVFRILKMVKYIKEVQVLKEALKSSRRKITVFLFTVLTLVVILGSLMYLIEGSDNGFTSIPRSIYWAIVTLTTVGYGDISPQTNIGQTLAAFIMILGYAIIAVPTGIVTVEMTKSANKIYQPVTCPECRAEIHDFDAKFCKYCGTKL